jgi:hypothetical protein
MAVPSGLLVAASSVLFPSFQMQESGAEIFGVDHTAPGSKAPFDLGDLTTGFGVQNRTVLVEPNSKEPLFGTTSRWRLRVEDGGLYFEDLLVSPGPLYVVARPTFGTQFDIGLGPYQTELILRGEDTGTAQIRLFLPVTFNPLGLANTDQDADGNVKYVFRAGLGGGVDATIGVGDRLLLAARTQGDYRYTYRAGGASETHNRGDVEWVLDAGIGVRPSPKTGVMATFFFQQWWQWEYDSDIEGVTRGNEIIGGRLTFRSYSDFGSAPSAPPPTPVPEPPPPTP